MSEEEQQRDWAERQNLLLHLGDVLEMISCILKCGDRYDTLAQAQAQEESLAGFPLLQFADPKQTPLEFAQRAAGAFFLWPKLLLDPEINRAALTQTVQHDLFASHPSGWDPYAQSLRLTVPWFGENPEPDRQAQP
jgi:hypothetical protein